MLRSGLMALLCCLPALACGLDELATSDLGDAPRCDDVDVWPTASANAEEELLDAIEDLRMTGAECGAETLAGVGPVEYSQQLHCAARLHAGDLVRNPQLEVDHEGSDGSTAQSRANSAGYDSIPRQELLAGDFVDAQALIDAWQDNPAHCRAILDDKLDDVGVGHAQTREGDRIIWVVVTGQDRE